MYTLENDWKWKIENRRRNVIQFNNYQLKEEKGKPDWNWDS